MPRLFSDPDVLYNDLILYNDGRETDFEPPEGLLGLNRLGNFGLGYFSIDETPFITVSAVIQTTSVKAITVGASVVRDLSDTYEIVSSEQDLDDVPSSTAYVGFGKERRPGYGAVPTFYVPLVEFSTNEGYDATPQRHIGLGVDAENIIKSIRNVSASFSFIPSSMGMVTFFSSLLWADPTTNAQGFYFLHQIEPGNKYNSLTVESGLDNQYIVRRYGMLVTSLNLSCAYGEAAQASVEMEGTLSELRDTRWTPDYYRTSALSFNNAQILQDDVQVADISSCSINISNSVSPYRLISKKLENNGFVLDGRDTSVEAEIDVRDQSFYTLMRDGSDFTIALELSDYNNENFVRIVLSNVEITSHENALRASPQRITAVPRQVGKSPILVQVGNHFRTPV